jgi:hypothetical protein
MRVVLWVVALGLSGALIKAVADMAPVPTLFLLCCATAACWLVVAKQATIDDAHRAASKYIPTVYRCGTCGAEFTSEIELNDHIWGLDEPVNFTCDCGFSSTIPKRAMFAHIASHRLENIKSLVQEEPREALDSNYHDELLKCSGCDFVTHFESQLIEHQVRHTAKVE